MNLDAVILAGGQSRRMGRDKAWLELEGQPLITRMASLVRSLEIGALFVSGRAGVDYSALNCPVLFDLEPGCGPMGGIERGLLHARSPLVLFLAVDLPRMTSTFLRKLYEQCANDERGAVPLLNGQTEPLAAIYPKQCHEIAVDRLSRGERSVRAYVEACLAQDAVRLYPVEPPDAVCFENWNTPPVAA